MTVALLECEIKEGLFPDEVTVIIDTKEAGHVSFFCPSEFIESSRVGVTILERSGSSVLVRIPAESGVGSVFVVDADRLKEKLIA